MIYCLSSNSNVIVSANAFNNIDKILQQYYNAVIIKVDKDSEQGSDIEKQTYVNSILADVKDGDVFVLQHPFWRCPSIEKMIIDRLHDMKNVYSVVFVHDVVEMMRWRSAEFIQSEINSFSPSDLIVLASEQLYRELSKCHDFEREGTQVEYYDIFDWPFDKKIRFDTETQFNTNLSYAGNIEHVHSELIKIDKLHVDVYSRGGQIIKDVKASLPANMDFRGFLGYDDISESLHKNGGFGLVWVYDEMVKRYYQYNCPYKLTTYIIAELPVVCMNGTRHSEFVKQYNIGICADTILDAQDKICSLSKAEYESMVRNVKLVKDLMLKGYFTRKMFNKVLERINVNHPVTIVSQTGELKSKLFDIIKK